MRVDYLTYKDGTGAESALRLLVIFVPSQTTGAFAGSLFAPDDAFPSVPSVASIWNSANWFEREAFDLYGIVFPVMRTSGVS